MRVQHVTDWNAFVGYAQAWNNLAQNNPFRGWVWARNWWANFGHNKELYLLAVFDSSEALIGIAPWFRTQNALSGRTLEFLGSGEVCTDYVGILAHPQNEDVVAGAIADWLITANGSEAVPLGRWDLLHLSGVAKDDCGVAKLVEQLVDLGSTVHRRDGVNCWRLTLPQSWTAYEELLSKSHRKQVRRLDRRFLQTGKAILRTASTASELAMGMNILIDLHQKRRQSLNQPGCFATGAFRCFLESTASELLDKSAVHLHWLELDQRPVAAEIHWLSETTVFAYQAGVDPDVLDEEPGRLITIATLQKAIADGRQTFDFLRGDEPYKAHFRAVPRPLLELRIAAPKGLSQVRHGVWLAGDAVKGWIKSSFNLSGMR